MKAMFVHEIDISGFMRWTSGWIVGISELASMYIATDFIALFYLIHRCAGHSMTDVTRLLENPVEATGIVHKFMLLLVKHML
jgi:hypothetical protein